MELYEAIDKRRTTREFSDKEVDFEVFEYAASLPHYVRSENVRLRYA